MQKISAALATAGFLVVAPGVVAGLLPWSLTGWQFRAVPGLVRVAGVALIGIGAIALLHAFTQFVTEGLGTPAPIAPTERLVVGGLHRYVRNPMYLAVVATIVGQGLLLGQPILFAYGAMAFATMAAFARVHEEPTLGRRFGAEYDHYRATVPAWVPRVTRHRQRGNHAT